MVTPIHAEAIVAPDGQIHVSVPGFAPGQRVRISIEPEEVSQAEKRHAADILAEMPGHRLLTSAEEADAYINEERDAWDR